MGLASTGTRWYSRDLAEEAIQKIDSIDRSLALKAYIPCRVTRILKTAKDNINLTVLVERS